MLAHGAFGPLSHKEFPTSPLITLRGLRGSRAMNTARDERNDHPISRTKNRIFFNRIFYNFKNLYENSQIFTEFGPP